MSRPASVRNFLTDDSPDGIGIVKKRNCIGRTMVASRTQLPDALHRDERPRPGLCVLAGAGDEGESRLYIGEADVLGDRRSLLASQLGGLLGQPRARQGLLQDLEVLRGDFDR